MERHFKRSIDELAVIVPFLQGAVDQLGFDAGTSFTLNMAVEELFTNMVKYNGNGADDILIGVDREGDWMKIRLVDFDSEPFDIADTGDVDTSAPLHARKPGGLGIHLVKRFMDEVLYEYKERKTTIRLGKRLTNDA